MIEGTVATQFETIAVAAEGCDMIVGATALQIAAPSVAEKMGIPYVFAAYCPTVLSSPYHAPIPWPAGRDASARNGRLPPEIEAFLEVDEPPVYFGFGSIRAPQDLSQVID